MIEHNDMFGQPLQRSKTNGNILITVEYFGDLNFNDSVQSGTIVDNHTDKERSFESGFPLTFGLAMTAWPMTYGVRS